MRLLLDDQPLSIDARTIAEGIAAGRDAALAEGRVIVEAKLDGRLLEGGELSSTIAGEGAELRLTSADPRALVAASLREVAGSLPDLRTAQAEAARRIQAGEYEAAFEHLGEAIAGWEGVRRVIDEGPRLLGIDASGLTPAGPRTVAASIDSLSAALSALQDAVRVQDWSTLADVLEGELTDAAREWEALLRGLSDIVGRTR